MDWTFRGFVASAQSKCVAATSLDCLAGVKRNPAAKIAFRILGIDKLAYVDPPRVSNHTTQ